MTIEQEREEIRDGRLASVYVAVKLLLRLALTISRNQPIPLQWLTSLHDLYRAQLDYEDRSAAIGDENAADRSGLDPLPDTTQLFEEIAEVCPVVSVFMGDASDRSTWSFVADSSATPAQIVAANNVVATISIVQKSIISPGDFVARFTNAEYLALEKKRRDDIAANNVGNAKNWDIVVGGLVNMNKKKVQTLKTDLVADGVLTQIRADEIFS